MQLGELQKNTELINRTMNTPTPRTDAAWSCFTGDTELLQSVKDLSHELERELNAVIEQRDGIESMYHKVIKEVLECDPIPACKREDDQLEPPWEVITRIIEQRDGLRAGIDYATDQLTKVTENRDRLAELLSDIRAYRKGIKPHDYWKQGANQAKADIMAFDAWQEIENKIEELLQTTPNPNRTNKMKHDDTPTPTPRTDDSETRVRKNCFSSIIEYCYANDMAKLERELTAMTEQRDRLVKALCSMRNQDHGSAIRAGMLLRSLNLQSLNQTTETK